MVLLRNGEVVPLKQKTFDVLLALAENAGEILSKNDLLDRVWKDSFVEEKNLSVQIAAGEEVSARQKTKIGSSPRYRDRVIRLSLTSPRQPETDTLLLIKNSHGSLSRMISNP